MRPAVTCCGCGLDPIKCECLDEDGTKIRDSAGHWSGKFGLPDEPPLVEGLVFSIVLTEMAISENVHAQVYIEPGGNRSAYMKLFTIPLQNFRHNDRVEICRDNGGERVWFAKRIGTGIYASYVRPYKAPEPFSGPSVVDQLPDIQAAAKTFRGLFQTAKTELRRLGTEMSATAAAAVFCQQRLNEQLAAGGVDCEFSRDAVRRRVAAELFMIRRIKQHVLDVRRLGPLFNVTAGDRDGMCDNGVDITT